LSTLLIAALLDLEPALAHVFLSNKNASQLAVVNQLKTKLQLVSYNLEHSDIKLALKHLEDATEIQTTKNNISSFSVPYLDYLHQLIESIPVDSEQTESLLQINETVEDASRFLDNKIVSDIDDRDLKNSTIQALSIANITNEILKEYAIAHGIDSVIATSGSVVNMMNMSNMGYSIDSSPSSMDLEDNGNGSRITNISNYQNAQELVRKALELFRDDLKPLGLSNTTRSFLTTDIRTSSVPESESGLSLLIDLIYNKKPFNDIIQIIHGPVHTKLFLAYDLNMIAE
jgi:hypothetical protein